DHLFLAREPCKRFLLAETFDRPCSRDGPVGLSGPADRGKRFGVALGNSDFIDMLAESDIRCPAAELGAASYVKNSHPNSPRSGNNYDALTVTSPYSTPLQTPGTGHAAAYRICYHCSHLVEHGVWPNQYWFPVRWRSSRGRGSDDAARGIIIPT